jgi:nucleoside-triphosphatase THEP1
MATSRGDVRIWQRAAVLGSLWASVEIVVGSFLHNLNVPFAGSVLAAFGVAVMTAGHRASPRRGLIWRAALVCALMKSVSPSAVILGPMVGIVTEGLLLQAAVALLGANVLGYAVGGALAVSFAQKILSALIAFGPDVVRLYVEAYNYASRSLGVSRFGPFDLVILLLVVECVLGVAAAVAGVRLGRVASRAGGAGSGTREGEQRGVPEQRTGINGCEAGGRIVASAAGKRAISAAFTWSIPNLVAFSSGLVGGMVLLGALTRAFGAAYVAAYGLLVFRTYPGAVVRLKRPMFWVQVAGVMLLAGLLLGGARSGMAGLLQGLNAGTDMVLRATLVVLGFTAVSVELRNPVILAWLERRRFRGLSDALGLAFGALPAFTAALADQRSFWRRPLAGLADLVRLADAVYESHEIPSENLIILTGETGSGKTTWAGEIVRALRNRGVKVGGVLATGLLTGARRSGFDITDLSTGRTVPLCREGDAGIGAEQRWSRFTFAREGLELGREALMVRGPSADVIVVDEVGPLELTGGGWAESLDALAGHFRGQILVVARFAVVEAVRARWGGVTTPVCRVGIDSPDDVAEIVVTRLAVTSIAPNPA